MLHAWAVLVIGFALPTAIAAAMEQHTRRQAEQAAAVEQLQPPLQQGAGPSKKGSVRPHRPGSSSGGSLEDLTAADVASAQGSAGWLSDSSGSSRGALSSAVLPAPPLAEQLLDHPAAQLGAHLARWLLLLLPTSALVWVALEVAAPRG